MEVIKYGLTVLPHYEQEEHQADRRCLPRCGQVGKQDLVGAWPVDGINSSKPRSSTRSPRSCGALPSFYAQSANEALFDQVPEVLAREGPFEAVLHAKVVALLPVIVGATAPLKL